MKKLLYIVGTLAGLFFIAVMLLPRMLDAQGFSETLRQKVEASGKYILQPPQSIDVSMFPVPRVILQNMSVASQHIEQINASMKVRTVIGEVPWTSVLVGNFTVGTVTLDGVEMDIALSDKRIGPKPLIELFQPLVASGFGEASEVVRVENAALRYRNAEAELMQLEQLNLRIEKAEQRLGKLTGTFVKDTLPYEFQLVPEVDNGMERIRADVSFPNGSLSLNGVIKPERNDIEADAELRLFTLEAEPPVPLMTLQGPIRWDGQRLVGQDIQVKQGDTNGTLGFTLGFSEKVSAFLELGMRHVSLEYLPALRVLQNVRPKTEESLLNWLYSLTIPDDVNFGFRLAIDRADWNDHQFKVIQAQGELRDSVLMVNQLVSGLPGEGQLVGFGVARGNRDALTVEGSVEAFGSDMKALLQTTGLQTNSLASGKFGEYGFRTGFLLSQDQIQFRDMEIALDKLTMKGAVILDVRDLEKPEFRALARIANLDVDGYFGKGLVREVMPVGALDDAEKVQQLDLGWMRWIPGQWQANLAIENGRLAGQAMKDVELMATAQKDTALFSGINGNYAGSQVSGDIQIENRATPYLKLKLNISDIRMPEITMLEAAGETPKTRVEGARDWSKAQLDVRFMNWANMDLELQTDRLKLHDISLSNLKLQSEIRDGTLTVKSMSGEVFDGSFGVNGYLTAGSVPLMSFGVNASNISVGKTLGYFFDVHSTSGAMNVEAKINSSGLSPYSIVQHMSGSLMVVAGDVEVQGLDLPYIGQGLASIASVSDIVNLTWRAMSMGSSNFSYAAAGWIIENGLAETSTGKIVFDNGTGTVRGKVNLLDWLMDMNLVLEFNPFEEDITPKLGIRMMDRLWSPRVELDTKAVEAYITQKAAEELLQKGR